jgi:hypothetical protein
MACVGRGTRPPPRGFLLRPILHPTRGAPGGDAAPHRPPVGVSYLHPDDPREVERDAPRKSEGSEGLEEHEDPIVEGARNYQRAFKREFYTNYQPISVHIRDIRLSGQVHNNKIERMNGEVRDREKVMRGVKRMDTPILKGAQIYHNFIKPHEGLQGRTPAEAAGIKVEGEDRWKTLIQNATTHSCKA